MHFESVPVVSNQNHDQLKSFRMHFESLPVFVVRSTVILRISVIMVLTTEYRNQFEVHIVMQIHFHLENPCILKQHLQLLKQRIFFSHVSQIPSGFSQPLYLPLYQTFWQEIRIVTTGQYRGHCWKFRQIFLLAFSKFDFKFVFPGINKSITKLT